MKNFGIALQSVSPPRQQGFNLLQSVSPPRQQGFNLRFSLAAIESLCALMIFLTSGLSETPAKTSSPTFEKNIFPIFQAKCLKCHGVEKLKGDLDLRTKAGLMKGGENGPAIKPGSAKDSLLWEKLRTNKMPPGKEKLSDAEKNLIKAWIESGAKEDGIVIAAKIPLPDDDPKEVTEADRQFWSFRPPVRPPIPLVKQKDRVRNPIDAFVVAGLEKKGLSLSAEADRLTLMRRAYFDLIGLPPNPREVDDYLADQSPNAYEKLIDKLLASKHYGERWGRHWLDIAGYADSEGILDADYVRTAAWRYRDYVIKSFNQDKPYDRFLKEQLAGDELVDYWTAYRTQKELKPEIVEALVATGYLRCASDTSRPDFVNIKNAPGYYYQTLDDTVKIVASSTLGLTVECAKCHSHKYDPIPQSEYYRLQAIFMSGYRPSEWVPQEQRRLLEATAVQEKEAGAKSAAAVAGLRKKADDLKKKYAGYLFTERLGKLPEAIREDVRKALAAEPSKRTEVQKYLAEKFDKELRPDANTLDRVLPEKFMIYKNQVKELEDAIKAERNNKDRLPEIRAFYDLPGEAKTHILRRGDYQNLGREVQPGTLSALAAPKPFQWKPPAKDARSSGRRLAFAGWLTQPNHPLTARVMVNRVWLHHFGEGIVTTPDNFGHTGAAPSNAELLDWLATEFTARGWSIKTMHRLIMTSSAYRQTSALKESAKRLDPDNRFFWRQRLRRLEAETIRDAILCSSGTLNSQMYGTPVPMIPNREGEVTAPNDASGQRRSVYLQVRRTQPLTLLQVFDQPVMETNCTRRGVSIVSSQALTLLNSDFLIGQAEAFADRVLKENPADPIGCAIRIAFSRPATGNERTKLGAFLDQQTARYLKTNGNGSGKPAAGSEQPARRQALADLCQMLMNANEFVYVD